MFCPRCGTWTRDDAVSCPLCGLGLQDPHASSPAPTHAARVTPVIAAVAYGGFWRRFVAALLDTLILYFPAATVRVLLGLPVTGMFDPETSASWVATTFEFVLDFGYTTALICSPARGTLGMQVMDLHVTDLNGDRIGFARATGRYFATLLSLLTCGIGYLLQLFTSRRQTLHDLIAGTVVVRSAHARAHAPVPVMRLVP
jgi:uncharacterized RDD family membrane protein YckC